MFKNFTLAMILSSSMLYAFESTSGLESEHFMADFWQGANGKYYIHIFEYDEKDRPIDHLFYFDDMHHAKECKCSLPKKKN